MSFADHYVFMDGCIVKGCKPVLAFEPTFGEYGALLQELYVRHAWGWTGRRLWRVPMPVHVRFEDWAERHIHTAQSTQNLRTGARRVDAILRQIPGHGHIHLFGTSAAGAAFLEYFLLTDPATLYFHASDPGDLRRPARQYQIDRRLASVTTIDAPTNWVPLRRDPGPIRVKNGPGTLGRYLATHTRIRAGGGVPPGRQTTRFEDVPNTWVESTPVAGVAYDDRPHFDHLPPPGVERHIYTGSHASAETRAFLLRVWR